MEDIRLALLRKEGAKLSKKEYKFAVKVEYKRLYQQLIFLSMVSFLVGLVLFLSLFPEMNQDKQMPSDH